MNATNLVSKIVHITDTCGDAEQINDAIELHVARALRDDPQHDAASVIAAQAEAVARELQEKGLPFRVLGQVCDSFRREESRYPSTGKPGAPLAAAVATPTASQARAATPVHTTSASAAVTPPPCMAQSRATTQYGNHGSYGNNGSYGSSGNYRTSSNFGSRPMGGFGMGMGTNSAMLQMEAMQDDMMANNLMMEGAMLDATGNVAAGSALQSEAMMLENQANMDRMMGGGFGGGFGGW